MKPEWRRFAPIGLYISLLAILVSGGLYIVQREWNLPLQISLAFIVVGLALFALLDPERVRVMLQGRQARYGSNALVLSLAFIGILVMANYLVYQNSQRWDLTEDKEYTLAPETIETLKTLPEAVTAQAFFTSRISSDDARSLLDQYAFNSDGRFSYEFIDPEQNPVLAENAQVTRDGTLVLMMSGRQQAITTISEEELTGGLVRLINPSAQTIYFLTGHGEYSPEDSGDQSYSQVKGALEAKNYSVKTLNLLATNQIPEDAAVIVVAGSRKPVSQAEVEQLNTYLEAGGALVVLSEPLPVTDFGDEADPLAEMLSSDWGIELGKDIVVDLTSQQAFAPYAAEYGNHAITSKMERMTAQFPSVRSVQVANPPEGVSPVELVKTAQQSWAEIDLASLNEQNAGQQVAFTEGEDQPGPISLAAAAENFQQNSRLVVFGDSDFATTGNYGAYGNGDLLINSMDWAAGQESLISLTPKASTQRLLLPPQRMAMNLILLGTVFVMPGLVLVAGILSWLQRRRRG